MSVRKESKVCEQCGERFEYVLQKGMNTRKFCGRECYKQCMKEIHTPISEDPKSSLSLWERLRHYAGLSDLWVSTISLGISIIGIYLLMSTKTSVSLGYFVIAIGMISYFGWYLYDGR